MRVLCIIASIYLAVVMQIVVAPELALAGVAPDFLAITALVWVLARPSRFGFLAAAAFGLTADLMWPPHMSPPHMSPPHVGPATIAYLLTGYVLGRLCVYTPRGSLSSQFLLLMPGVAAVIFATTLLHVAVGDLSVNWIPILSQSAAAGLYSALVGLPALMILGWTREVGMSKQPSLRQW